VKALAIAPLQVILVAFAVTLTAVSLSAGKKSGEQEGEASYYAQVLNGQKTASGEIYDKNAFTAAHRSLSFGTKVRVTYLKTGKSVDVVINDRGPFVKGRIIDLSRAAAEKIGLTEDGSGKVKLEILKK
jgi:rare lipoprotein A